MSNHTGIYLLLLLSVFTNLPQTARSITFPGDIQILKDLKNGLDKNSITPGSCLSSWDFSVDPCDHLFTSRFTCGFRCDRLVSCFSRVTEITLDPTGYSGPLGSTAWNLPYLQTLDLSDNSFHGPIPDSLSNLTGLNRLCLSRNSLTGPVPGLLGSLSLLQELYLDNNLLVGPIPPSFNGLVSLKRLELQRNNLSGEIPDLGSLKNLYYLDLSDNRLSGEVPATLPTSLVELSLRNNTLFGKLPNNLASLVVLQVMDLSYNELAGRVGSALFDHPSLEQLTLSHNRFSSLEVATNGGVNSKLIAVDLSHNELRGLLPVFMGSMAELAALSLEHNKFTGMIPSQYAVKAALPGPGASPFQRLLLGGNYLFGPIPGPLLGLKEGSVNVSLVDNCLYQCPDMFFFCQGADQKSLLDCKSFGPCIP